MAFVGAHIAAAEKRMMAKSISDAVAALPPEARPEGDRDVLSIQQVRKVSEAVGCIRMTFAIWDYIDSQVATVPLAIAPCLHGGDGNKYVPARRIGLRIWSPELM